MYCRRKNSIGNYALKTFSTFSEAVKEEKILLKKEKEEKKRKERKISCKLCGIYDSGYLPRSSDILNY